VYSELKRVLNNIINGTTRYGAYIAARVYLSLGVEGPGYLPSLKSWYSICARIGTTVVATCAPYTIAGIRIHLQLPVDDKANIIWSKILQILTNQNH
jgi:hypothetical protein